MDRTGLRVIRSENQALDARVSQGAGTHDARLNCNKEIAVFQAMVTNDCTGRAKGDDLSVGRGVVAHEVAVPTLSDDLAAAHDHGTHRDLARFQRTLSGAQGGFHEKFVRVIGGWSSVVCHHASRSGGKPLASCIVMGSNLESWLGRCAGSEQVQDGADAFGDQTRQSHTDICEQPVCQENNGNDQTRPSKFRSRCQQTLHGRVLGIDTGGGA